MSDQEILRTLELSLIAMKMAETQIENLERQIKDLQAQLDKARGTSH